MHLNCFVMNAKEMVARMSGVGTEYNIPFAINEGRRNNVLVQCAPAAIVECLLCTLPTFK